MMFNYNEGMPFTSYWYYKNAKPLHCQCSDSDNQHHLLRYRIYFSLLLFRFPTSTQYYLVCANCGAMKRLDSEGEVAKVVSRVQGVEPIKYDKYSQMNLDGYDEDQIIPFGTERELKARVRIHLNDMIGK